MDPRPENDPNQWADLQPSEREERRYAVWLERSLGWRGIAGAWKPVKVLGAGSYGLCGLFKYVGNGGNFPAYIVVKQSGGPDKDLRTESRLMKQLGVSRSPHIIKLYKSYHEAAGTGTSDQFDPSPYNNVPNGGLTYSPHREVSRIYMEYCAKGDMWKWLVELHDKYVFNLTAALSLY